MTTFTIVIDFPNGHEENYDLPPFTTETQAEGAAIQKAAEVPDLDVYLYFQDKNTGITGYINRTGKSSKGVSW